MNDTELLQEAIKLLATMELRGYDPERQQIVISKLMWLELTKDFRERMGYEQHRRLVGVPS